MKNRIPFLIICLAFVIIIIGCKNQVVQPYRWENCTLAELPYDVCIKYGCETCCHPLPRHACFVTYEGYCFGDKSKNEGYVNIESGDWWRCIMWGN